MSYSLPLTESQLKKLRDQFVKTIKQGQRTKLKASTLEKLFVCALGIKVSYGNLIAQARKNTVEINVANIDIKELCRKETEHSIDCFGKALIKLYYALFNNETVVSQLYHDFLVYDLIETAYKNMKNHDWKIDAIFNAVINNEKEFTRINYQEDGYFNVNMLFFNFNVDKDMFNFREHENEFECFVERFSGQTDSSEVEKILDEKAGIWFKAFTLDNISQVVKDIFIEQQISSAYFDIRAVIKMEVQKTETAAFKQLMNNNHYSECQYYVYPEAIVMLDTLGIYQLVHITPEQYKALSRVVKQGELYDQKFYSQIDAIFKKGQSLEQKRLVLASWQDTLSRCIKSYQENKYFRPNLLGHDDAANKSYAEILETHLIQ